jgi:hypothetical protein
MDVPPLILTSIRYMIVFLFLLPGLLQAKRKFAAAEPRGLALPGGPDCLLHDHPGRAIYGAGAPGRDYDKLAAEYYRTDGGGVGINFPVGTAIPGAVDRDGHLPCEGSLFTFCR